MNAQLIGNLSSQQLRRALEIKEKIEALEAQLNSMLGTSAPAAAKPAPVAKKAGGRRPMSPEARARIVAAQKLRWAKIRAQAKAKPAAATPAKAPKRKVSAAARARLAELARARWAKVKAAGKSRL
jgi:hypothetical protein